MIDLRQLVHLALEEDLGSGDVTSHITVDPGTHGVAQVLSRGSGVLSGLAPFREVFAQLDPSLRLESSFQDGDRLKKNDLVISLSGAAQSILAGERTALNFLGILSGVATLTRRFVNAVEGTRAYILDTRKTTPLMRFLEKQAVIHGGGSNHRQGLYDMILVKENHESAAGGIAATFQRLDIFFLQTRKQVPVVIEIQSVEQLGEVLSLREKFPNVPLLRIMLDNFGLDSISQAVSRAAGRIPLEVSGRVTLESVRQIALTGVDFISIGSLTHSAPAFDFSLLLEI